MLERWLQRLHKVEDLLLATLLGSLLLVSVAQIVLRTFFDTGLDWAEPVSRAGVLWLALLGALGATRARKHIAIDALPRVLPPRAQRVAWVLSHLAAAAITATLAWLGAGMVGLVREAPVPFVAGIPSWWPMLAFPAGFGLMALRFLLVALSQPPPGAIEEGGA